MTETLTLSRDFDAAPAAIYARWTDADKMAAWFAPRGFTLKAAQADARKDGAWRVVYADPKGQEIEESGTYLSLDPFSGLTMTLQHRYDDGSKGPLTTITVSFAPKAQGTRMEFRQDGIANAEMRDGMADGWGGCFDQIAEAEGRSAAAA